MTPPVWTSLLLLAHEFSLTVLDCEGWGFESNFFFIDGWLATSDIPNGSLPGGTGNLVVDSVNEPGFDQCPF